MRTTTRRPEYRRRARTCQRYQRSVFEDFPHDPSYWWPDDRTWVFCGDIDFEWAYVEASTACVEEILSVPVIDGVRTRPENPAHSGMDLVNDPNGEVPRS
jgi:hypothetical protein